MPAASAPPPSYPVDPPRPTPRTNRTRRVDARPCRPRPPALRTGDHVARAPVRRGAGDMEWMRPERNYNAYINCPLELAIGPAPPLPRLRACVHAPAPSSPATPTRRDSVRGRMTAPNCPDHAGPTTCPTGVFGGNYDVTLRCGTRARPPAARTLQVSPGKLPGRCATQHVPQLRCEPRPLSQLDLRKTRFPPSESFPLSERARDRAPAQDLLSDTPAVRDRRVAGGAGGVRRPAARVLPARRGPLHGQRRKHLRGLRFERVVRQRRGWPGAPRAGAPN